MVESPVVTRAADGGNNSVPSEMPDFYSGNSLRVWMPVARLDARLFLPFSCSWSHAGDTSLLERLLSAFMYLHALRRYELDRWSHFWSGTWTLVSAARPSVS